MIGRGARNTGRQSEALAVRWLESRGLRLLDRNYTCRAGELDLVMQDAEHLVIVEVKYRARDALVSGPESVTPVKQARIVRAALHFLQQHPELQQRPARFDVLAITGSEPEQHIDWLRDAFQPAL